MIEATADLIDILAVLVLVCGLVVSTAAAVDGYRRTEGPWRARLTGAPLAAFRLTLGRWLLTALEILIVSDILHSISHRTLEEVGLLAAIVVIRVTIAYFLDQELSRMEARAESGGGNGEAKAVAETIRADASP